MSEEMDYKPFRAWYTVALLVLFSVSSFVDRSLISLLIEPIKADLDLTDTEFGFAQGLGFAAIFAICAIPFGMAADRYDRRRLILAGVLTWSVGCIACGLAWDFPSLVAARMTVGVGEAVLTPVAISLIGDIFPLNRRGAAIGVFSTSPYISYLVSFTGGGALVAFLNGQGGFHLPGFVTLETWRATFVLIGAPGFVLALLALSMLDPRRGRADRPSGARSEAGSWRGIWRLRRQVLIPFLVGMGTLVGMSAIIVQWSPAFLIRRFALPVDEIGLWIGVSMGILAPFGSIIVGTILDRAIQRKIYTGPFIVGIVTPLLVVPVIIASSVQSDSLPALILLAMSFFLMSGIATVLGTSIQLIAPPDARGKITGLTIVLTAGFGQGVTGLLVALFTDHVLKDSTQIGIGIAVVAAGLGLVTVLAFWAGLAPLKRLFNSGDGHRA